MYNQEDESASFLLTVNPRDVFLYDPGNVSDMLFNVDEDDTISMTFSDYGYELFRSFD